MNGSSVPPEFKNRGRQTLYKGIKMRSRLEARVAWFLDESEVDWQYEPMCFAGGGGQYLPDFKLTDGVFLRGHGVSSLYQGSVYLEVKPVRPMGKAWKDVSSRMKIIWESEPKAALLLMWEAEACLWLPEMEDGLAVEVGRCHECLGFTILALGDAGTPCCLCAGEPIGLGAKT